MPTLYDCALLADAAYGYLNAPPAGWVKLKTSFNDHDIKSHQGYLGLALVNDSRKEIVVSHRGTEFNDKNPRRIFKTPYYNLKSDSLIFFDKLPHESQLALVFSEMVCNENPGYEIIQVGHSLGGFHAMVCAYVNNHYAITFDPPGCKEILIKIDQKLDDKKLKKLYAFFMAYNLINQVGVQVGNVYVKNSPEALQDIYQTKSIKRFSTTKETHSLINFIEHIKTVSHDPRHVVDDIAFAKHIVSNTELKDIDDSSAYKVRCIIS